MTQVQGNTPDPIDLAFEANDREWQRLGRDEQEKIKRHDWPELYEHEDLIHYEVLDDGTCSYCGHEAEMVQTPEGVWPSDRCEHCDQFNEELRAGRI